MLNFFSILEIGAHCALGQKRDRSQAKIHSLFSTDNFIFSKERFDSICLPAFLKDSQERSAVFNNFRHSSVSPDLRG